MAGRADDGRIGTVDCLACLTGECTVAGPSPGILEGGAAEMARGLLPRHILVGPEAVFAVLILLIRLHDLIKEGHGRRPVLKALWPAGSAGGPLVLTWKGIRWRVVTKPALHDGFANAAAVFRPQPCLPARFAENNSVDDHDSLRHADHNIREIGKVHFLCR